MKKFMTLAAAAILFTGFGIISLNAAETETETETIAETEIQQQDVSTAR